MTAVTQAAILAVLARSLSGSEFAFVAVLLGAIGILGFLDLGIGNSVINDVARDLRRGPGGVASVAVSSALLALVVPAVVVVVGVWTLVAAVLWFDPFPSAGLNSSESVIAAAVFATSIGIAPASLLGSKVAVAVGRGTQNSFISMVASLSSLVLTVPLVLNRGGVVWAVIAVALVPVLINVSQTVYLLLGPRRVIVVSKGCVSLNQVRRTLRSGLPYLIINLAAILTIQTQSLVVAAAIGLSSVSTFVVCLRMFQIVLTLFGAGLQQLWAVLAALLGTGKVDDARRIFWRTLAFSVIVHVFVCGVIAVLGESIVAVWVGGDIVPSSTLLWWLAGWTVYRAVATQFSFLCNAADRVWVQAAASVALAIVAVPMSLYATGRVGVSGPVIVAFLGHSMLVFPFLLYGAVRALGYDFLKLAKRA